MERVIPPGHASARQTEMGDQFDKTMFAALDAIEESRIPFAMIGGIAASALSRPRSTHDIDFFVRPEDADAALEALGRHGFETERTDERWLYKGWMGKMMVDIIFKSQGDIYFDDEMQRRARPIEYHGRKVPAVAPEDLIIIKCAVASEVGPHHWHDALAILSHATVDWNYLMKRGRKAARRLIALLIYAQSNDIWIPNGVVNQLFGSVFGELPKQADFNMGASPSVAAQAAPMRSETLLRPKGDATSGQSRSQEMYFVEKIREAIAKDPRTAAMDIRIFVAGHQLVAKGEVNTEDQRLAIETVIREIAPEYGVENQVKCCEITAPTSTEEVV